MPPATKDKKGAVGPLKYAPGTARTLVVTVVDPARKKAGVSGVTVEVLGLSIKTTGADGKATFKDLPVAGEGESAKEWILRVRKAGYGPPPPDGLPWREWQVERKPIPTSEPVCAVEVELTTPGTIDITVRVVTGKDPKKGIAKAAVEVWSLRGGREPNTAADGTVRWKGVSLLRKDGTAVTELAIKVNKEGWGFYSAEQWVEGEVMEVVPVPPGATAIERTITLHERDEAKAAKIDQLRASQPQLAGLDHRSPLEGPSEANALGRDETDITTASFAPKVFVCGGPPVLIELKGLDLKWGEGYIPAKWRVEAHATNAGAPTPTLQPGGNHCRVPTTCPGVFTVWAKVGEGERAINLAFVKVTITTSAAKTAPHNFRQGNTGGPGVTCDTGDFDVPNTPWLVTWSVSVSGGRTRDQDKVRVVPIQNGIHNDPVATYSAKNGVVGTHREFVKSLPVLDTGMKSTPYCVGQYMFAAGTSPAKLEADMEMELTGSTRHFRLLDAPNVTFFKKHHHTGASLGGGTIRGPMRFRAAVAAFSTDWPGMAVVLGVLTWGVEFRFDVAESWTGSWTLTNAGSTVTTDSAFTPLDPPQDAAAAGFRLTGLRFNDGNARDFDRRCTPPCPQDAP
ncbi:MAG: hypothetical protein KF878_19000 [Planctomycetes bacterium]|nr:hypothetical protein [Planctomycetota bacterium]